jgi:putative spermidine/putrescine transport system substrate-binding protein
MIPANLRARDAGSPENLAKQIRLNSEWYADNYASSLEQYLKLSAR